MTMEDFNRDFPGVPGVKNPSANAGHIDLIPDPGRSACHRTTKSMHNY